MFFARRRAPAPPSAGMLVEQADTAPCEVPAQHTRLATLRYLPVACLLLALLACGGTLNVSITHRPASDLRLELRITGQYSDKPNVQVLVTVFEGTNSQTVFPASDARLTCDGSDIMPSAANLTHSCPRQAPGGVYQIAYTDEHGATTTMRVPVPLGVFAIRSPVPGSLVPIPTNGALVVRFSTPMPTPQGSVTIDNVDAWCGGASQISCGYVASGGLYNTIATPSVAPASATVPATPVPQSCAPTPVPRDPLVTMSGSQGTVTLSGGFGEFQPGPGRIEMIVEACVMPIQSGFVAAPVNFMDGLSAPITWARSAQ